MAMYIVIGAVFVLCIVAYQYWARVVLPRQQKVHIDQLKRLIQEWYSHIDKNFNKGVNKQFLNELEGKILKFIEGTELRSVHMNFTPAFRAKFLASKGFNKDLQMSEMLFEKHAGVELKPLDLHTYWLNLRRSFYQFYWNYTGDGFEKYFESLETKVDLLMQYFQ